MTSFRCVYSFLVEFRKLYLFTSLGFISSIAYSGNSLFIYLISSDRIYRICAFDVWMQLMLFSISHWSKVSHFRPNRPQNVYKTQYHIFKYIFCIFLLIFYSTLKCHHKAYNRSSVRFIGQIISFIGNFEGGKSNYEAMKRSNNKNFSQIGFWNSLISNWFRFFFGNPQLLKWTIILEMWNVLYVEMG